MSLVFVTGASGFVGRVLLSRLVACGETVRAGVRDPHLTFGSGIETRAYDLEATPDWPRLLSGVEVVYHLAARVHRLHESEAEAEQGNQRINHLATLELARAAATAGCRRLVYVSSIKVNGEATGESPFSSDDPMAPEDAYGRAKRDAELGLHAIAADAGLEVCIVRPPLVYGPCVGANFLRLLQLVRRGIPLPFASVTNARSLVYVGNLADLLVTCGRNPTATGKTFLVSDGMPLSTPELIRSIANALERPARLWPFPPKLLIGLGRMFGRRKEISRLTGSLVVDDTSTRELLGWKPPWSIHEGLVETVHWLEACPDA
jgi:nucleoside-diphosphate-sugar epimerase